MADQIDSRSCLCKPPCRLNVLVSLTTASCTSPCFFACSRKNVIPLNVGLWGWSAHVAVVQKYGENGYVFQEVPQGQGGQPALSIVDIMTRYNIPSFDIIKVGPEDATVSSATMRGCGKLQMALM